MGLDAYVGEYETPEYISERLGSYSGYDGWRKAIAEAAGICLDNMDGYGGDESWEGKPFNLILNHSDCEGEYTINQIPELLKELKEVKKLGIDVERTNRFIKLCNAAMKYNKPIIFA